MIKLKKPSQIILTLGISFTLLFIFFGNILVAPNTVFFSKSGDGLKSTFGSYYHLKYDTSYWHTNSMNFPYGESVLFTGGQPLIVNSLKLASNFGFDFSNNLLGILNVWMLLSIVLAALFLFLLLVELKLPWHYSLVVANIIAFLSPQLGRFGGHYNLAYVYFLPLFLYLLKLFFNRPTYKISIIIGLVSLLALGTQAYFFALNSIWVVFLLLYGFFFEKDRFGKLLPILLHLLIQIILPFILFSLITYSYPSDRSAFPWGFFMTRSFPEAVFLPVGKPYGKFLHFSYLKWEGIAYIGFVASLTTLTLIISFLKSQKISTKITFSQLFKVTDNGFLNAILLGSVVALFISFAYPFQWHLQWLLNYMGPFKQFRASGRFNWLFYYTINIIAYYLIWQFYKNKKKPLRLVLVIIALLWGSYDTYLNAKGRGVQLENRIPELEDTTNNLPQNKWLKNINKNEFQSILTLPYFHVGSEVYWVSQSSIAEKNAFMLSWKTGIPLSDVMLSRTSISQTMKSLGLIFEPLSTFQIINDYPNKKDLLLIIQKNEILNKNEQRLAKYGQFIEENEFYFAYRLPIDSLIKLQKDYTNQILNDIENIELFEKKYFLVSDTNSNFIFQSYGIKTPELNHDNSCKTFLGRKVNIVMDTLLFNNIEPLKISFWMNNLDKDLIPRSTVKVGIKGSKGEYQQKSLNTIFKLVKYVDANGWGLVEFDYIPSEPNETIRIEIWNDLVTSEHISIDDILILNIGNNIYFKNDDFLYMNNRYISNSILTN